MKKALIVSGGEYSQVLNPDSFDFIIACDKGLEYCLKDGITPDLASGDFDSFNGEIPSEIETIRLPAEKDDTDTMFAVKYLLEKGFNDITITSALGKRIDHEIANIQTLSYIAKNGGKGSILGNKNKLFCFSDSSQIFPEEKDSFISVFSLTETCENVTIKGAKYNLENAELNSIFPLGTSNEWKTDRIAVSVGKGILLVVVSKIQ